MTGQRCCYSFTWQDQFSEEFQSIGELNRHRTPDGDEFKVAVFNGKLIGEHSCCRPTKGDDKFCPLHSESNYNTKIIREELTFSKEIPIFEAKIGGYTFRDLDLDGYEIYFSSFHESRIDNSTFERGILVGCDFSNAELNNVDFSKSRLHHTRFVDADIDINSPLGELTNFAKSDCSGANFVGANFEEANFSGSKFNNNSRLCKSLIGADFSFADLSETEFRGLMLHGSDFTNSDLGHIKWENIEFENADFENSYLFDADIFDSNFERASFSKANLQEAKLENSEIHSAVLADAIVDHGTEFDDECLYEKRLKGTNHQRNAAEIAQKAAWVYRTLSRLCENNALTDDAQEYYIKEKDIQRRSRWIQYCGIVNSERSGISAFLETKLKYLIRLISGSYVLGRENTESEGEYSELSARNDMAEGSQTDLSKMNRRETIKSEMSRLVIGYGEGPWNVIFSLAFVTLFYTLIYPIWGIKTSNGVMKYEWKLETLFTLTPAVPVDSWLTSLYFSVVTFTTLGYGDLQPHGFSRYVAASEAFIGASLLALLVFVLGRRATW
ncbi:MULTISPECIES: pentapeptide repeat-containing protein [unclassified Haloferax]|uniref:pentapeptide repeat-containing protein n=1 Tax=unclassified Haloferax TaxID=2625095 RepID=UPI0009DAF096|nr:MULTISPECIES: pentapeptide repeat-containing protein [unclassified Haloferax]